MRGAMDTHTLTRDVVLLCSCVGIGLPVSKKVVVAIFEAVDKAALHIWDNTMK